MFCWPANPAKKISGGSLDHKDRVDKIRGLLTQQNVDKALARLRKNNALQKYAAIQDGFRRVDVFKDRGFQKSFAGFYRVRRGERWRSIYYKVMERAKRNPSVVSFNEILEVLYRETGIVEKSFASKMAATIDPGLPVLDSIVLAHFGLSEREYKKAHLSGLEWVKQIYEDLGRCYRELLGSREGCSAIQRFDKIFSEKKDSVSSIKKMDLILWAIRGS